MEKERVEGEREREKEEEKKRKERKRRKRERLEEKPGLRLTLSTLSSVYLSFLSSLLLSSFSLSVCLHALSLSGHHDRV